VNRNSDVYTQIAAGRSPSHGIGPDAARFALSIHKAFASASSQSGVPTKGYPMSSISSIPAPAPVKPIEASAPPKAPDPKVDGDSDDASEAPKVAAAPLPPGQGARIDQLA
jgi:hypothetical protein